MSHSHSQTYTLVDSGGGKKLEQFGSYLLIRPCSQAVWKPQLPSHVWEQAHGTFSREGKMRWSGRRSTEESWWIDLEGLSLKIAPTEFGHLGVFPEHRLAWRWLASAIGNKKGIRVLNLFGYSGGASLAAARAGAEVCHVDASQGMVQWARENSRASGLEKAPIRWIVDDCRKFLAREKRRGREYDLILLDPPSFGRGAKGEIFKIEEDLSALLKQCVELLSPNPRGFFLSCHTPGYTPTVLQHLLSQHLLSHQGSFSGGELLLEGKEGVLPVPCGAYAKWESHDPSDH